MEASKVSFEILTDTQITAQRSMLITTAGMTVNHMNELAARYELDQEHQAILRHINALDFLTQP